MDQLSVTFEYVVNLIMSCKGSQMHCDVEGLVERSDHISEHRPTESQCKRSIHSVFSNEGGNYT